jgi:hypothetical protein
MGSTCIGVLVNREFTRKMMYRLLLCRFETEGGFCKYWRAESKWVSEDDVISAIKGGLKVINAKLSGTQELIGDPLSLERLNWKSLVIVSELYDEYDEKKSNCIGYKMVSSTGQMMDCTKSQAVAAARNRGGSHPVQNYAFDKENGILRRGSEGQMIVKELVRRPARKTG